MRRTGIALLVGVLLLAASGCGDPEADYCAALNKDQAVFADDGTGIQLVVNLGRLRALAQVAPDDLSDEWQTLLSALGALDQTIRGAGLKPEQFVDGRPPTGISAAVRARIASAASQITASDVVDAAAGIDQQARDVCKLQLGIPGN